MVTPCLSVIVTGNVIFPSACTDSPENPTMGVEDFFKPLSSRSIRSQQDMGKDHLVRTTPSARVAGRPADAKRRAGDIVAPNHGRWRSGLFGCYPEPLGHIGGRRRAGWRLPLRPWRPLDTPKQCQVDFHCHARGLPRRGDVGREP